MKISKISFENKIFQTVSAILVKILKSCSIELKFGFGNYTWCIDFWKIQNSEKKCRKIERSEDSIEDIDWNDSILPAENNNNNKEEETENTIKSLCTDIDWEDISIVNEKNILTPQTSGEEEEQRMVDTFISELKLGSTQKTFMKNNVGEGNNNNNNNNIEEEEQQNIEERAEIYNWFEENNVNSYDMEAEWEIPAFSMSQ